jgi:hypothetical protein
VVESCEKRRALISSQVVDANKTMRSDIATPPQRGTGLVDLLDRVLDKGLVIAGDIKISLAEVELLTIRIRLIVCSIDKAEQIGLDWWRYDKHLAPGSGSQDLVKENEKLREQIQVLQGKAATPVKKRSGAPPARRLRR